MIKQIKTSLQIGAVFIGTIVGAGFASGQEIMQFFTCFGKIGMITLIISGFTFYLIAAAVMKAAAYYKTYNYKDIIYRVAGHKLGFVFDILLTAFLLIGTSIMFSGSGALFKESLGISKNWGIAIMALMTLIIVLQSLNGILRINSIIVPMLFSVIVVVLGYTIMNSDIGSISSRLSQNYQGSPFKPIVFFIFYCCYNTFLSIGVLTAIPEKTRNPSVIKLGVFFGAMGLMLLSLMLNISLTLKSPQVFEYSIPMSYITSDFGSIVKNAVTFCIWCEIFSTAVSNAFGVAKRLSANNKVGYSQACFIIVTCCLPLSFIEFKGLISLFYPIFGALSMFIIFKLIYFSYALEKGMKKANSLALMLFLLIIYIISNPQRSISAIEINKELYDITLKQDILCLMLAYPEYIENMEQLNGQTYIIMKSGKKILYDDKRPKSIETKIAYPDLQDMLEQAYYAGSIKEIININHDPGRARVYSLLNEVYGGTQKQIESNLTYVKVGNRSFQFNKNNRASEALKNVMEELILLSEKRTDIRNNVFPCNGTYNYRKIAGTNRLSAHAYGTAIDLVIDKRDYWQWASREEGKKRLASYPAEIIELFEEHNFIWGGKWGHFDIMHFEYRPEILIKTRYFGSSMTSDQSWYKGAPMGDEYVKSCIEKIEEATQNNDKSWELFLKMLQGGI